MAKQTGTVSVTFREDKLKAINVFLGQKGKSVEGELVECLDGLYKKFVPAQAKMLIEADDEAPAKSRQAAVTASTLGV